jgi:hypothetical protein
MLMRRKWKRKRKGKEEGNHGKVDQINPAKYSFSNI